MPPRKTGFQLPPFGQVLFDKFVELAHKYPPLSAERFAELTQKRDRGTEKKQGIDDRKQRPDIYAQKATDILDLTLYHGLDLFKRVCENHTSLIGVMRGILKNEFDQYIHPLFYYLNDPGFLNFGYMPHFVDNEGLYQRGMLIKAFLETVLKAIEQKFIDAPGIFNAPVVGPKAQMNDRLKKLKEEAEKYERNHPDAKAKCDEKFLNEWNAFVAKAKPIGEAQKQLIAAQPPALIQAQKKLGDHQEKMLKLQKDIDDLTGEHAEKPSEKLARKIKEKQTEMQQLEAQETTLQFEVTKIEAALMLSTLPERLENLQKQIDDITEEMRAAQDPHALARLKAKREILSEQYTDLENIPQDMGMLEKIKKHLLAYNEAKVKLDAAQEALTAKMKKFAATAPTPATDDRASAQALAAIASRGSAVIAPGITTDTAAAAADIVERPQHQAALQ